MFSVMQFLHLYFSVIYLIDLVSSHGRLFQPPGRSTAWRYGFTTPKNYNDHELYCGGFSTQWGRNGGKCGLCGDPYQQPRPRANENGGVYGRGVIVNKYKRGQNIEIGVQLTANHKGFFEFSICPLNTPNFYESEDCFKYKLRRSDNQDYRYFPGPGSKKFFVKYSLPKRLTCKHCVLQWRYVAGNQWGKCPNGTGMLGCGPQEEFRSCSDILIMDEEGFADETPGIRIPDIPTDDEDYNEVDVDVKQNDKEIEDSLHSYAGQVTALILAFLFAILLLLSLLISYLWNKGIMKDMLKDCGGYKWRSFLIFPAFSRKNNNNDETKYFSSTLNRQKSPLPQDVLAPPIPPRKNRKLEQNTGLSGVGKIHRPILSISSPTCVSINGVQVKHSPYNSNCDDYKDHRFS